MSPTEQAYLGAIGALTAALLALVAIVRRKSRKPENGHEEAIREFLHSDEGRRIIHKAAKHEISNAVFMVSAAINAEEPPECIDSYRRRVVKRVVDDFRGWKE